MPPTEQVEYVITVECGPTLVDADDGRTKPRSDRYCYTSPEKAKAAYDAASAALLKHVGD